MSRQPVATPSATEDAMSMLTTWWARAMSPTVPFLARELRWQEDRTERVVRRLVRAELVYVVARTGRLVPGRRWARPAWMVEAGMTVGRSGLSRDVSREAGAIRPLVALVVVVVIVAALVATAQHWLPWAAMAFLAALVAHGRRRGGARRHLGRDLVLGALGWEAWRHHRRRRQRAATWQRPSPLGPTGSTVELGDAFEAHVARVLGARGWALRPVGAHVAGTAGDGGVDLAGRDPNGRTVVVQAKAGAGSIGASTVRDLLGARTLAGAEVAVLATTRVLTPAARQAAADGQVMVLDGTRLAMLARAGEREALA